MRYPEGPLGRKDALRPFPPATRPAPHPLALAPHAPAAPAPAPDVPARSPEPPGSRLVVGPNIKLKGVEIDDCDTLVVEGRVEAAVASRVIQIAEGGSFKGSAQAGEAEVRGAFEGELTVHGRLVAHATARISGKVRYGKLLVQEGGEIAGDVGPAGAGPGGPRPA
jgi:cytoskeletal protein CcmA (bactofilin family)